ncbi:hypothetical protein [Amycolatopsis sp. YIM 10]|uniref:hypothetical protein n=1 Tax=Amycolatopsis sp. YIM 10 TaxID=2653857 RepID=UPI00129025FB|nr:hypothetical protein [Amycolatopsis sp. YIM 10]QFU87842.1 hypothetical protein YIM_13280 [Amycolatopsis sp. YIM 10]QFU94845.1 hypothetical protein YIM_48600 [Amycolatopsis sp. YIM 10]
MTSVHFTSDHPPAQDIIDALRAAIAYPGSFGERQHADDGHPETRESWQARAAYAVVGPLLDQLAGIGAEASPGEMHQLLAAYGESPAPHVTRRSAAAPELFAIGSELLDACHAAETLEPHYVQGVFARHLPAVDEH